MAEECSRCMISVVVRHLETADQLYNNAKLFQSCSNRVRSSPKVDMKTQHQRLSHEWLKLSHWFEQLEGWLEGKGTAAQ